MGPHSYCLDRRLWKLWVGVRVRGDFNGCRGIWFTILQVNIPVEHVKHAFYDLAFVVINSKAVVAIVNLLPTERRLNFDGKSAKFDFFSGFADNTHRLIWHIWFAKIVIIDLDDIPIARIKFIATTSISILFDTNSSYTLLQSSYLWWQSDLNANGVIVGGNVPACDCIIFWDASFDACLSETVWQTDCLVCSSFFLPNMKSKNPIWYLSIFVF